MRARYDFLKSYVPLTSETLLATTVQQIDELRDDTFRLHRTVILSSMITTGGHFGEHAPQQELFPSFILKPAEVSPPKVSPQLLQQASQFFAYLHAHGIELLDAILIISSKPEFNYLVSSAIPALFGYFASQEHFDLAFPFYLRIFSATNSVTGFKILTSFLSSPLMFRYFESAFTPLFDRLTRDSRLHRSSQNHTELQKLGDIYARDMTGLFISSVSLIPRKVCLLFSLMKTQWGMKESVDRIIHQLFKTFAFQFLDVSRHQRYRSFLEVVFSRVTRPMAESVILQISVGKSDFEIPELFHLFGHPFLSFCSCVADIDALAKVFELKMKLPPSLSSFCFENTPRHAVFWFKIFQKVRLPPPSTESPLVFAPVPVTVPPNATFERMYRRLQSDFPDPFEYLRSKSSCAPDFREFALTMAVADLTELAASFESLIRHRHLHAYIREWARVAEEHERIAIAEIATLAAQQVKKSKHAEIEVVYRRASNLFRSRLVNRDQFFMLVESSIQESEQKLLAKLVELWSDYMERKSARLEVTEIGVEGRSANSVFWEVVEGLKGIDGQPLAIGFRLLAKSLTLLFGLPEAQTRREELTRIAVVLAQSRDIVKLYFLVSQSARESSLFAGLCNDSEMFAWVNLESVLLKMLMETVDLRMKFFDLQQTIKFGKRHSH
jgi:hypothetical protein